MDSLTGTGPDRGRPRRRLRYEVCVESVGGARAALAAGADRVELCRELSMDGLTPHRGAVAEVVGLARDALHVHVLVRPRPGDFVYSPRALTTMAADVRRAKIGGAQGVVLGALTPGGRVDLAAMRSLISEARPLSVTFHRAFDRARDPYEALEDLVDLGVDRVLTSGGRASALEGAPLVRALVHRSAGRLVVLVGGGITEQNAGAVAVATGAGELHFSARRRDGAPPAEEFPHEGLAERVAAIIRNAEAAS